MSGPPLSSYLPSSTLHMFVGFIIQSKSARQLRSFSPFIKLLASVFLNSVSNVSIFGYVLNLAATALRLAPSIFWIFEKLTQISLYNCMIFTYGVGSDLAGAAASCSGGTLKGSFISLVLSTLVLSTLPAVVCWSSGGRPSVFLAAARRRLERSFSASRCWIRVPAYSSQSWIVRVAGSSLP